MSTLPDTVRTPSSRSTLEQHQRISTLDGWRGVAIVLVLIDHVTQRTRFEHRAWANLGTLGVYIFFVISGYIITTRLIEERQNTCTINLSAFYLRRAFRILPIVIVYVACLYLINRFIGLKDFQYREIVGSLFFFRNYQFAAHPGGLYTAHFWSLSVEEHFYILWPTLLLWSGNSRALRLAISLAVACSLWRIYHHSEAIHELIRTDRMIDGLFLGSALALLILHPSFRNLISRNLKREGMALVGFMLFLNLEWTHSFPSSITFALIALMIAGTLLIEEGLVYQFLNSRILVWVGTISYSLYVWQQLVLLHPSKSLPFGMLSIFPWNLLSVFAVATASYYLFREARHRHRQKMVTQEKYTILAPLMMQR